MDIIISIVVIIAIIIIIYGTLYSMIIIAFHAFDEICGYEPKEFIHTIGDAHIYKNHFDVVKTQIEREPLPLPRLVLNKDIDNLFDFKIEDIKLEGYQSHGPLKGKVSV